jgi:Fibronectin type III domain
VCERRRPSTPSAVAHTRLGNLVAIKDEIVVRAASSSKQILVLAVVALLGVWYPIEEAHARGLLEQLAPSRPSDLVTIRSSGVKCTPSPWLKLDTQVNGDGTLSPFVIPTGQVLVVTSVDFRQGNTGVSGRQEEFFLFPSAANISVNYAIVDLMAAPGSSDGRAGVSAVVTGVAIKAGNPCWGVNNIAAQGSADALIHGFLTADLTPPGPPRNLTATASGRTITVTWAAPTTGGAADSYVLEVGSASGLANLATVPVTATSFSASGVPPGTFYFRVRAVNTTGPGPVSADVQLVVQ